MQLIKWFLILLLLGAATAIAAPFIFMALFFNEYDAKKFLESTGKAISRKCAIDLRKGKV